MNEPDKNKLVTAIDEMLDILLTGNSHGFANEAQRLDFFFRKLRQKERSWRHSHPCMFPGCQDRSILRSHTIPRSGPLALIEENGHVISPKVHMGVLRGLPVGIGEASTFPGFCPTHEGIFQSFERNKKLVSSADLLLQCLRQICREIRVKEEQRRFMNDLVQDHREIVQKRGLEILRQRLGDTFMSQQSVSMLNIDGFDSLSSTLQKEIKELDLTISQYRDRFLKPLMDELDRKGDNFSAVALTIPVHLPVGLAGRGNFRIQDADGVHDIVAILNVWPQEESTDVIMLVQKQHEAAAHAYFASFQQPEFRFVSMVESWMVHGTDHWFLKPSVWDEIPQHRQDVILQDILDTSFNIGQEYKGSIFDGLRRQMLDMNRDDKRSEVQQYLAFERNKLV
jgi:hypothetical protein